MPDKAPKPGNLEAEEGTAKDPSFLCPGLLSSVFDVPDDGYFGSCGI